MIYIIITNRKDNSLIEYIDASDYTVKKFYETVYAYSLNFNVNIERTV